MADYSRLDEELRGFAANFPGFDISVPPEQGARAMLKALGPPPPPDPAIVKHHNVDANGVRLWVLEPVTASNTGIVLYWGHGGGFILGVPEADTPLLSFFVSQGITVVSADYRLAPEHKHPAALDDFETGYKWLVNQGQSLSSVDPKKLVIGGTSAGGGLAAAMLRRIHGKKDIIQPAFVVLESPAVEDRVDEKLYPSLAKNHPLSHCFVWSRQNCIDMSQWIYEKDEKDFEMSLLRRNEDLSGLPPHFISAFECDSVRDISTEYARRLYSSNVPTELHVYKGAFHVPATFCPETKIGQRVMQDIVDAIKRNTL